MTTVYIEGKQYFLIRPSIPDPDHWVQLIPIKEKPIPVKPKCDHDFYNVGLNTGIVLGQRWSKCGFQERF